MIRLWVAGLIAGTAVIGVTSPWFVRSYVPRIESAERSVLVLQPGSHYRWRQEGYATTTIGRWGNAGIATMAVHRNPNIRVALWGDSQAEGVCVDDSQKIAALATRISDQPIGVVSFASSGDDCNDWIHQLQSLADSTDPSLQFDAHVFLVVELSDWSIVAEQIETDVPNWQNRITWTLPDFMIHAARNILVDAQTDQVRGLRFTPGRVTPGESTAERVPPNDAVDLAKRFRNQLERLKRSADAPCYLLYAPKIPAIVNGNIVTDDDQQPAFEVFTAIADAIGIEVVDVRAAMAQSVQKGNWPRGFHNGQFGVGHYNATGNAIIADALVRVVKQDSGD